MLKALVLQLLDTTVLSSRRFQIINLHPPYAKGDGELGGAEVQARPRLESTTRFQGLTLEKDNSAFNLNLVLLSLPPLQLGQ